MRGNQAMDAGERELEALAAQVRQNERTIEVLQQRVKGKRMRARFWLVALGCASALALAAVAGGVYASIPSTADGQIHGCYPRGGGVLRLIDTQASPLAKCAASENPVGWSTNGSPAHIQEYADPSKPIQIVIPPAVGFITVELWGAGGGGGTECFSGGGAEGGGGGGGAYVRAVIPVTSGETLTLAVGKRGAGTFSGDGTAGAATTVMRGATTLASAGGGGGGTAADCSGFPPFGGFPGAGGTPATSLANASTRPGNGGDGIGGGGPAIQGSVGMLGLRGGGGEGLASSGGDGDAIVSW